MSNAPDTTYSWTIRQMARALKLNPGYVNRRLNQSPHCHDYRHIPNKQGGQPPRAYRLEAYLWLKDDTAELRRHLRLGTHVSVRQACIDVDISRETFFSLLDKHPEFGPVTYRIGGNGRPVMAISRQSYQALVDFIPPYAPAGWYTEGDICRLTGWAPYKVRRYIQSNNIKPRRYRTSETSQIQAHYPGDQFQMLGTKPPTPPAGGWHTETQIFKRLGSRPRWARSQLHSYYRPVAQRRLSARNQICWHYPPWVLARLYAELQHRNCQDIAS